MADDPINRALNHSEQWAQYHRRMQTYDVLKQQWEDNGKLGPPPPRPVKPHTPGWNPSASE